MNEIILEQACSMKKENSSRRFCKKSYISVCLTPLNKKISLKKVKHQKFITKHDFAFNFYFWVYDFDFKLTPPGHDEMQKGKMKLKYEVSLPSLQSPTLPEKQ